MSKIFYIMGKSASGKDSVFRKLKATFPELKEIVLYTTRPIRAGEEDGREYHFVTEEQLQAFEEQGRVIEKREYHTEHGIWKYFTVDDGQVDLTKGNYLVIGTLESYLAMRRYFGQEALVPIYVEVEDGERLLRAIGREQSQHKPRFAEMCRRFLADTQDFSETHLQEAGITKRFQNHQLEQCIDEITLFIQEKI